MVLTAHNCSQLGDEKEEQTSMHNRFSTFLPPGYINIEKDQSSFL